MEKGLPTTLQDIDDVMANFNKVTRELAWERYKIRIEHEDIKSWNWIVTKLGKTRAYVLFNDVWSFNSERVEAMEPNLGKTIAEMRKRRNVVVATGRQNTEDTLNVLGWLHGEGVQFDGFVSVNIRRLKKNDLLKYDEIVDDGTPNLEAAIKMGKVAFIRDQPWNKTVPEGRYSRRIRRLAEVVEYQKHIDRLGGLPDLKSAARDVSAPIKADDRLKRGNAKVRRV